MQILMNKFASEVLERYQEDAHEETRSRNNACDKRHTAARALYGLLFPDGVPATRHLEIA